MTADRANVVILAALGVVVAATFGLAAANDRPKPPAPVSTADPYQTCLDAANTPGAGGFAVEVCEPLSQGYEEPSVVLRDSDFGLDACVTFPARGDSDAIVYCPRVRP